MLRKIEYFALNNAYGRTLVSSDQLCATAWRWNGNHVRRPMNFSMMGVMHTNHKVVTLCTALWLTFILPLKMYKSIEL